MLFDILRRFADGDGSGEVKEHVDVGFDGIDEYRRATEILQNGCHVSVQRFLNAVVKQGSDSFVLKMR